MKPKPRSHRSPAQACSWCLHLATLIGLRQIPVALVWGLTLLIGSAIPGAAAIWTVCPNGCDANSIQGGISLASPGDTIDLLTTAPHTEADILVNKSVIVRGLEGVGGGIRGAATQGTASARVFTVLPGVTLEIHTVEISFGNALEGGGIFNQGILVLEDVELARNDATDVGGGLFNDIGGYAVLRRSQVTDNFGQNGGGGVWNRGTLVVENSLLVENVTNGFGGGIRNQIGHLTLYRTYVRNNLASVGGGLYDSGSGLTIEDSYFSGNEAGLGGALYLKATGAAARISQSTLSENIADFGGAIYTRASSAPRLHGVTLYGNLAHHGGGAVYVYGGKSIVLRSTTMARNIADQTTASNGGGGGIRLGTECDTTICFAARAHLTNTLIADNTDVTDADTRDCFGILTSHGYNLLGAGSSGVVGACRIEGDLTGVQVNVDAVLGSFANHGGPLTWNGVTPWTLPIGGSGPAVDTGDPAGCIDGQGYPLDYDQRYAPRRGGRCDLGAFEFGGIPAPPDPLFGDGFETGTTQFWSSSSP
ncbi:MAG: hypothetical protein K8J08_02165 [Thermoanaerobaculia bacterium]|nr:hypothetical protein [Thermoanaerobaculia bacterium]